MEVGFLERNLIKRQITFTSTWRRRKEQYYLIKSPRAVASECRNGIMKVVVVSPEWNGIIKWYILSRVRLNLLHVPGVAEVNSALGSALVRAILQRDHILASLELLIAELAHVLLRLLRTDRRLSHVVRLPAQRLQANDDRVQVLSLPKVYALESLLRWHAELLGYFQEIYNGRESRLDTPRQLFKLTHLWYSPCTWKPSCSR